MHTTVSGQNEKTSEYHPIEWTQKEIRAAIPSHLFVRSTSVGLMYVARDITLAALLWYGASFIDPIFKTFRPQLCFALGPTGGLVIRCLSWIVYWWFQGLTFTALWILGHECGHFTLSESRLLCNMIGYTLHTILWTPFFSWKYSHHRHHSNNASMEKDEIYVPDTRSQRGLPPKSHEPINYEEYLSDTPLYTISTLLFQQLLGFPAYLLTNVSGQKQYPRWTNHFNPNAVLFNSEQRNNIILSDLGIFFTAWLTRYALRVFGITQILKFYGVPWLLLSHWVTMITFLQHTDPHVPHFRQGGWSFVRGAAATVDRDFLGWQGRFFFHNATRYHVVHHFFPLIPFYHGEEATVYLRAFLGEQYIYSDKPVFKALWDNFRACQFVEDDGDIVFYKNRQGRAARRVAGDKTVES